jgi:hypothetical protein
MHLPGTFRFAAQNGHQAFHRLLVGFHPNLKVVISTIPSCAYCRYIWHRCTKWLPGLKKKNIFMLSQVKLLVECQPNFKGVISIIHCCECRWHVLLCCTKWPPELKIEEKHRPAFTCKAAGGISKKLHE